MSDAGRFVKLHGTILRSSIWQESHGTRLVWITLLALADLEGNVHNCSIGGLCHAARVSRDEAEDAIRVLEAPDPDSTSSAFEGRRLMRVDGGFTILNYERYRDMPTPAAIRQRRYRERKKELEALEARIEAAKQEHTFVTGADGVMPRDASDVTQPSQVTTKNKTKTKTKTKTNTATENNKVGQEPDAPASDKLIMIDGDGKGTEVDALTLEVPPSEDVVALEAKAAREVFDYWRARVSKPGSQWTPERLRVIKARMKEEPGTLADKIAGLKLAVDGAATDPFFNGSENGNELLGFENVFVHQGRNRIEKLQGLARKPSRLARKGQGAADAARALVSGGLGGGQ